MKNFTNVTIIILFTTILISCNQHASEKKEGSVTTMDTTKLKAGESYYQCEMDHDVISDKSGSCSKCGMDLTKIEKK